MPTAPGRERSAGVQDSAASAGSFLGRRREVAEVVELLDRARLVTLTGPPGIGKSRLALAVAAERPAGRSGDVALVELAAVDDPTLVADAFAAALSIREVPGQSVTQTLVAGVGERDVLVVLDNCEHLVRACAELVEALLEGCPRLCVLATSREPLATPDELVSHVPPLSTPDRSEPSRSERLLDYDAICLFVERARAVEPDFALNDYIAPAVVEICRRLDGMPLSIEIAAARVEALTPAEIAGRLDHRFGLLTDERGAEPRRHRTLETAIDWSYRLLSASERALLRRLSVFLGSFNREAAAAVCTGDGVTEASMAKLIDRLVSKSLLATDPDEGRLRLLETIRAYGGERLEESGEARAVREAHARFYMTLAEQAEPQLSGPAQQQWFERLELERPNLRAALEWSVGHGRAEWALRLCAALVLFWQVRCHFSEGRHMLAAALASGGGTAPRAEASALWGQGFLIMMAGDVGGAIPLLEASLERFNALNDTEGRGRSLFLLGHCRQLCGDLTGLALIEEGAGLARKADDSWCLAAALGVAGFSSLAHRDDFAAARPLFEEAMTVARAARDSHGLRIGLFGLGLVALREGDHRLAERLLNECVAVAEGMGELYAQASAMRYLGDAAFMRGEYAQARELLEESLLLLRGFGPDVSLLVMLATVARAEGRRQQARALLEEALRFARTSGDNLAGALQGMGELEAEEGRLAAARRLLEEAVELASSSYGRLSAAGVRYRLGEVMREDGHANRAAVLHHDALQLRHEIRHRPGIVVSLEAIAGLAADAGRYKHAARLLAAAEKTREEHRYARAPWTRDRYEHALTRARDGLSDEDFKRACGAGAALSLDEAVAEASEGSGRPELEPDGWSCLTESEHQVAALVAQGLTNPEIARQLLVSVSTVKHRLASIFCKLGVTRRSELASQFARRDQQQPPEAPL